ncbi:MAG TPA: hypothetical protein VMK12_26510 [Anaeromyxobacteraceae bacterium]|nr:hypothetical protein [Anaeromyxobacteraceae bacterium]
MADEEVLPYGPFKKTGDSPILFWRAYRCGKEGGFAGTSVVATTLPVFTAPTEERLKDLAKELGYGLQRVEDPDHSSGAGDRVEVGAPPFDHPQT